MPKRSSNTAGATYLNRERRLADVRASLVRARERMPEIEEARLFGSLVSGTPTPASDADLLIVVRASSESSPRQRIPGVLAALAPLPCAIDLVVLTRHEFDAACRDGDPLVREALAGGVRLL